MMTLSRFLACGLFLFALGQSFAANTTRLYDFEEGIVGTPAESVQDKVDTLLFAGSGFNRGNYWVEVPGTAPRPLPEGSLADVVQGIALTAPPLEAFFGAVEFADVSDGTDLDSPQPGSTIAASFDGATVLEDFDTAEGSRGVFISESAYDNNAFMEAGVNTFEEYSILAQGWVRPDSAWNGLEQTVWSVGDDQGRLRISGDDTPVWQVTGLGSAFEDGGLFPEIPVAFDEWTHIGIFRGGAGAEVYLNGELVAGDRNPAEPKFIGTFASNISLGGEALEFETFRGLVDDFRVSGFADNDLGPGEMDYCDAFVSDPICPFERQPCDLVIDGQCDISDLDLLVRQVVRGSTHSAFDINGDGTVDVMDVTDPENGWLAQAGEFFA
ncbi:MAG: LamG-like jellyroll fold domain-containing protein, partial [Planctomycetota bacterium]